MHQIDGTQLAAIASNERDIIVWSYPSGEILFQKHLPEQIQQIVWNPFRPNLFATFKRWVSCFRRESLTDLRSPNFLKMASKSAEWGFF
jgi:hypothetical protein